MSDTWAELLRQAEPNYDTLKDIMYNGPKIVARMRTFNNKWRVRVEEDWGVAEQPDRNGNSKLDIRCEWACEQLASWQSVNRMSYQEWMFPDRARAEKFLTLYNLKWAE